MPITKTIKDSVGGAAVPDATIESGNPNSNYGSATTAYAGATTGKTGVVFYHYLTKWDCSEIPAQSRIDSVEFKAWVAFPFGSGKLMNFHRVTTDWSEMQVTWNDRITSTPWSSPGGDYDASQFDQFSAPTSTGFFTRSSSGLVSAVVDALQNRSGILNMIWRQHYSPPFFSPDLLSLITGDYYLSTYRPQLTVVYTHPAVFRRRREGNRPRVLAA